MTQSGITEKASQLLQLVQDQKASLNYFVKRPQKALFLLDLAPEWVSKRILSFASGILDPYLLAKGLEVEEWSPTKVGLYLPDRWINRLGRGSRSENLSNVFSLSQMAFRLYWEWQVGLDGHPIEISQLQWESLQSGMGGVKVRYQVDASVRDEWLFYLRRDGRVEINAEALVLDKRELIIGVVRSQILLTGPKYLR